MNEKSTQLVLESVVILVVRVALIVSIVLSRMLAEIWAVIWAERRKRNTNLTPIYHWLADRVRNHGIRVCDALRVVQSDCPELYDWERIRTQLRNTAEHNDQQTVQIRWDGGRQLVSAQVRPQYCALRLQLRLCSPLLGHRLHVSPTALTGAPIPATAPDDRSTWSLAE